MPFALLSTVILHMLFNQMVVLFSSSLYVMQKRKVGGAAPLRIPLTRRFWQYLLQRENLDVDSTWASLSTKAMRQLSSVLKRCPFLVSGKVNFNCSVVVFNHLMSSVCHISSWVSSCETSCVSEKEVLCWLLNVHNVNHRFCGLLTAIVDNLLIIIAGFASFFCDPFVSCFGNMQGEFKDEFVTSGGVPLVEVNLKTMESRVCPGLFLAGEVLDIDGVTGGFNFQNAWTGGYISGSEIASSATVYLRRSFVSAVGTLG